MPGESSLSSRRPIHLKCDVDLRLEGFGSLVFRKGRFDFMEVNHLGTLVCSLIRDHSTSIDELAFSLANRYGRSIMEVREDISEFLGDLYRRGFIENGDKIPSKVLYKIFDETVKGLEEGWVLLPEREFYSAPLQFHWEITKECNLRCIHCYANAVPIREEMADNIDWDRCISLLEILHEMKVVQINFLGGEPMIEEKFIPLLEHASELGFDVTFPSNGLFFTRDNLERMKAIGMKFITISLDSADPAIFEDIRGKKGIFARVNDNIRLAREVGMEVVVNAVLMRSTIKGFEDLIEMLIELDVSTLKVIDEFPVGRGFINSERLLISPEEYKEFYVRMIRILEPRYRNRLDIQLSPRFAVREELEREDLIRDGTTEAVPARDRNDPSIDYRCSAGRSQCFCTVDWDIYPCYLFYGEKEFSPGNVQDRSFKDIWNDPESFKSFRERMGSIPECEGCEFSDTCKGGCRGDVYKFTRDFLAGNPYCWNLKKEK